LPFFLGKNTAKKGAIITAIFSGGSKNTTIFSGGAKNTAKKSFLKQLQQDEVNQQ